MNCIRQVFVKSFCLQGTAQNVCFETRCGVSWPDYLRIRSSRFSASDLFLQTVTAQIRYLDANVRSINRAGHTFNELKLTNDCVGFGIFAQNECAFYSRYFFSGRESLANVRMVLPATAFAASLANPVTLGALQLRADVNQRSAANRASRLAGLLTLLALCLYGVSAWTVLLCGLHRIGPSNYFDDRSMERLTSIQLPSSMTLSPASLAAWLPLASSAPGCIQIFLTPVAIACWMTSRVT